MALHSSNGRRTYGPSTAPDDIRRTYGPAGASLAPVHGPAVLAGCSAWKEALASAARAREGTLGAGCYGMAGEARKRIMHAASRCALHPPAAGSRFVAAYLAVALLAAYQLVTSLVGEWAPAGQAARLPLLGGSLGLLTLLMLVPVGSGGLFSQAAACDAAGPGCRAEPADAAAPGTGPRRHEKVHERPAPLASTLHHAVCLSVCLRTLVAANGCSGVFNQ
jgi:hypothetical protein